DRGFGLFDHRALSCVLTRGRGRFVVFVAREEGAPVVGAGHRGRAFGRRGVTRGGAVPGRDRSEHIVVASFVGVEPARDRPVGPVRSDQAGERGGVFDLFAVCPRRGRRGLDRRFGLFDHRALVFIAAFARDRFVVCIAREAGDPVVGAG